MLTARTGNRLLIVLEPGNIDQLQIGKPIAIKLPEGVTEIGIAYTPDIVWVRNEVKRGESLITTLEKSLGRDEVHLRPHHEPESLQNIKE